MLRFLILISVISVLSVNLKLSSASVKILAVSKIIMEENQIVPDVIDFAPENCIEITYPSGAVVNLGNELTPTEVKDTPHVTWEADDNELYTLLLTDPDAISRDNPNLREVRHWLVVNIPGNNVAEGQTLYEYIGSGPPQGTGLHRYVFLVFKQSGKIKSDVFVSNSSREQRVKTSTRELISDFGFDNPIAGNFYQAQYDDYVPVLQQQLGGAPATE